MANSNDKQAMFMEAMNSLKEYAKVNGGFVTKDDVTSYFKGMSIDDNKLQMIYGYLMANNIKVKGETQVDNSFLQMMEQAVEHDQEAVNQNDESANALDHNTYQVTNALNKQESKSINIEGIDTDISTDSDALQNQNNEKRDRLKNQINSNLNYKEDEKYLTLYQEDLKSIEKLSDQTRAFLLVNIVEDNDKESLQLLSQSFLEDIIKWIEPFRNQGILASDLVQEGNLAMMAYMSEKRFLHNLEWKDKIKEGNTADIMNVLNAISQDIKSEIEGSIRMMIDEQYDSAKVSQKVLNKVNLINDWAKRLKDELGRKATVEEIADKIGISKDNVLEAVQLSAEAIEDIDLKDNSKQEN